MPAGHGFDPLDPEKKEIRVLSFETHDGSATDEILGHEIEVTYREPHRSGSVSEINCSLSHISLASTENRDNYSALSYVWGVAEPRTPISIGGHISHVAPNLISALRHLRSQIKIPFQNLWIDAICIEQTDDVEKASQVDMMSDIYRQADQVFIWLGESGEDSDLALELLDSVPYQEGDDAVQRFTDERADRDIEWKALEKLFKRDYWGRVWILQEVLLSQKAFVICGDRICSWEAVMALLKRTYHIKSQAARQAILERKLLPVRLVETVRARRQGDAQLLDYLVLARQRKASVAHDYIYGVMGLMNSQVTQANYSKPAELVFQEMAIHMLKKEKDVGILSMCCENTLRTTGQATPPTWVPDWRYQFREVYQSLLLCRQRYDAGLTSKYEAELETVEEDRILQIQGRLIDTITFVSSAQPSLNRWPQVGEDWSSWLRRSTARSNRYGAFEGQRAAFIGALYCDYDGICHERDGFGQYFDLAVSESNPRPTKEELTHPTRTFGKAGRQFFGTETGYMGRGMYDIQPGDIVAVIKGAKVPFVLRKSDRAGFYRLVGECYLHGFMKGELAGLEEYQQWECLSIV